MPESLKAFDNIDYQILHMLHEDCWVTVAEMSRRLRINERTTKRRLERLVSTGACRPAVVVSPDAFGYTTIVDIELHVEQAHYDGAVAFFTGNVAVSYLSAGWGEMNMLVQARFKNSEEMASFINETIPGLQGVTIVKYEIVPKIYFNTDKWMPEEGDFKKK